MFYEFTFRSHPKDIHLRHVNHFEMDRSPLLQAYEDTPHMTVSDIIEPRLSQDIYSSECGEKFFSPKIQQHLQENNLTGYKFLDISIDDAHLQGYKQFLITGSIEKIELKREIVEAEKNNVQGQYYQGIQCDESTWDGTDFFCGVYAGAYYFNFCTQKAYEVLKHYPDLFRCSPIAEVMYDTFLFDSAK